MTPKNPTGDPAKDDLYEDQVPPPAPAVPGNGDEAKATGDGDQADNG